MPVEISLWPLGYPLKPKLLLTTQPSSVASKACTDLATLPGPFECLSPVAICCHLVWWWAECGGFAALGPCCGELATVACAMPEDQRTGLWITLRSI